MLQPESHESESIIEWTTAHDRNRQRLDKVTPSILDAFGKSLPCSSDVMLLPDGALAQIQSKSALDWENPTVIPIIKPYQ